MADIPAASEARAVSLAMRSGFMWVVMLGPGREQSAASRMGDSKRYRGGPEAEQSAVLFAFDSGAPGVADQAVTRVILDRFFPVVHGWHPPSSVMLTRAEDFDRRAAKSIRSWEQARAARVMREDKCGRPVRSSFQNNFGKWFTRRRRRAAPRVPQTFRS